MKCSFWFEFEHENSSNLVGSQILNLVIRIEELWSRCNRELNCNIGVGKRKTLVSSMTAERMPVLFMAWRRFSRVSWWYSCEPWEKLNLATFIPARSSFSAMGTEREAGPSVQTILVLGRLMLLISAILRSLCVCECECDCECESKLKLWIH